MRLCVAVTGSLAKPALAVAEFYEPELKKVGLAVTKNDMNMGGTLMVTLEGTSADGKKRTVAGTESGGQTMVVIGGDW